MPGLNQRGPFNEGPMTGNRQGICNTGSAVGKGAGFRAGQMGFGRRCGMGRRAGWNAFGSQFKAPDVTVSPQDKRSLLAERTRILEEELKAIQQELAGLNEG